VALNQTVYLWNASSGDIQELLSTQGDDYITSLSWAADGKHLGVGFSNSLTQIWDAERCKPIRNLTGHSARVSAMSWNNHTLSTGGRDSAILNHDVRVREHITATLRGHEQEVCGLKWSPNGTQVSAPRGCFGGVGGGAFGAQAAVPAASSQQLAPDQRRSSWPHAPLHTHLSPPPPLLQLASGGNDNLLMVWDAANDRPTHRITAHQAAVKALAWCPFQANLLATGGGTADRTIKFHNTHTGGEWVGRQSGSGRGLSCVEAVAHRGRGAGGGSFCLAAAFGLHTPGPFHTAQHEHKPPFCCSSRCCRGPPELH
jgi:cell division cycle protein 20 (cofactor of APC complex)